MLLRWCRLAQGSHSAAAGYRVTDGRLEVSLKDGSVTRLSNTNFWRIRDGKFQEVTVYMSGENPLV